VIARFIIRATYSLSQQEAGIPKMSRFTRTAVAGVASVMLMAQMAQAADPGAGHQGSGETPRGLATGTLLPGIVARALPVLEGPEELARTGRTVLDEESLRTAFGTVTRLSDGSVIVAPASDMLMQLLLADPQADPQGLPFDEGRAPLPRAGTWPMLAGIGTGWHPGQAQERVAQ
jgi:hypothetical protein